MKDRFLKRVKGPLTNKDSDLESLYWGWFSIDY
jgi:hypothetical protein